MTNAARAELLRASEEERRLYGELRATYERLTTLAGAQPDARIATEVERSEALLERARMLAARTGPARQGIDGSRPDPDLDELRRIWADSAAALTEILRLREHVLDGLRRALEDTRRSLVRVGLGRSAVARYRAAGGAGRFERQSRRA